MSEKLISEYKSTGKTLARMSTPPTTPSTIGCNSPDVLFATLDGSMECEKSELEESITDFERQVSARTVSPDDAFKFLTREAPPEPDFLEPKDSETVNQIIAGMMPSRISSKKSVRDLGNLSQPFQDKMAECEEEIEQKMRQAQYERMAACVGTAQVPKVKEEAPAKEESSKPRNVVFGLVDDVRLFSRTTEELNHMLEELSITSLSTDNCSSEDVEVSFVSTDEKYESFCHSDSLAVSETGITMGMPEESMVNVDHAKFPTLAERDAFAIYKEEDGGEVCADLHTGDIAVVNESGYKLGLSPYCFINVNCTDPRAVSESETSEVKGTKNYVDSDSIVSDFITESKWAEEEKSSGTNSTESTFGEDITHVLSDLRATFAKVGSELGQRLNCSGFINCSKSKYPHRSKYLHREAHLPYTENAMDISWVSPSYGDFDSTISGLDSLPDYGSTQLSRTFSLDMTAIPNINSMCTRESSMSSRNPNEHNKEQRCSF
jgi:hypothetical protein